MKTIARIIVLVVALTAVQALAVQVTQVTLNYENGTTVARVLADGPIQFSHQTEIPKDGKGDRMILDLIGATTGFSVKNFADLPKCGITGIRTAQYAVTPEKVVRVVFDLTRAPIYQIEKQGNGVKITFTDKSVTSFASWNSTSATTPTAPIPSAKPTQTTVAVTPKAVAPAVETKPVIATTASVQKPSAPMPTSTPAPVVAIKPTPQENKQVTPAPTPTKPAVAETSKPTPTVAVQPTTPLPKPASLTPTPAPIVATKPTPQENKQATPAPANAPTVAVKTTTPEANTQWKQTAITPTPVVATKPTPTVVVQPTTPLPKPASLTPTPAPVVATKPTQPESKQATPVTIPAPTPTKPVVVETSKPTPVVAVQPVTPLPEPASLTPTPAPVVATKPIEPEKKQVTPAATPAQAPAGTTVAQTTTTPATASPVAVKPSDKTAPGAPAVKIPNALADNAGEQIAEADEAEQSNPDLPANSKATSRFRRSGVNDAKIKGTMVAEFPQRLVVKYESSGNRDPFATLIDDSRTFNTPIQNRVPNIDGLRLVGIIESEQGASDNRALFEDKNGYSYILSSGDKVQRGYVLRVEDDRVYFQIFEYGWSRTVALAIENAN